MITIGDLQRIASLADVPDSSVLEKEFKLILEVLDQRQSQPAEGRDLCLSALFELSERQWRTYELLPDSIRERLDSVILTLWDRGSLDSTERLLGVIARLGLERAFALLSGTPRSGLPLEVALEIESAIDEFGQTVGDPYSGMR